MCSISCKWLAFCILLILSCLVGVLVFRSISWSKKPKQWANHLFLLLSCVCVIYSPLLFSFLYHLFFQIIIWGMFVLLSSLYQLCGRKMFSLFFRAPFLFCSQIYKCLFASFFIILFLSCISKVVNIKSSTIICCVCVVYFINDFL